MDNNAKRKSGPDIDEHYLMSIMAGSEKTPPEQPDPRRDPTPAKPAGKEKSRHKREATETDYEKLFFKNPETNARNGKSVYIRPEFHERLSRIVQVIGEDKLSLYAYLDNVLDHHFREFAEQITTSFNEKYKPIL